MTVTHIVQFSFKPSADATSIRRTCNRMLDLKNKCIHPVTHEKYLKSVSGGKDNSPEGFQNGFTHAFVVEFENEEDRDYYVKHDQAHQAFVASIDGLVSGVQVLDFAPGVF